MHRWGGEGREGSGRVQGEALQGGLGELVLPEGTPQGSRGGNSGKARMVQANHWLWCRRDIGDTSDHTSSACRPGGLGDRAGCRYTLS